jgi:hypothetical protein
LLKKLATLLKETYVSEVHNWFSGYLRTLYKLQIYLALNEDGKVEKALEASDRGLFAPFQYSPGDGSGKTSIRTANALPKTRTH